MSKSNSISCCGGTFSSFNLLLVRFCGRVGDLRTLLFAASSMAFFSGLVVRIVVRPVLLLPLTLETAATREKGSKSTGSTGVSFRTGIATSSASSVATGPSDSVGWVSSASIGRSSSLAARTSGSVGWVSSASVRRSSSAAVKTGSSIMIKEKYSSLYHFEKLLIVFKTIDIYDNNLPIGRSVTNDGRNAESGKLARD